MTDCPNCERLTKALETVSDLLEEGEVNRAFRAIDRALSQPPAQPEPASTVRLEDVRALNQLVRKPVSSTAQPEFTCPCGGKTVSLPVCARCGEQWVDGPSTDALEAAQPDCPRCEGRGSVWNGTCPSCDGNEMQPEPQSLPGHSKCPGGARLIVGEPAEKPEPRAESWTPLEIHNAIATASKGGDFDDRPVACWIARFCSLESGEELRQSHPMVTP